MSSRSSDILEKFTAMVGDLGGYESDFLYIASFVSTFETSLKVPSWTFVDLRAGLEPYSKGQIMKDIIRRCFGLAGRPIIAASGEIDTSRVDKGFARLLSERVVEARILFPNGPPDLSSGINPLPIETRTRLVRFLCQSVFESPSSSMAGSSSSIYPVAGIDAQGLRYFLLKDTSLEIGCWRELSRMGPVELVATSTDSISGMVAKLRIDLATPSRSKNICVYCRKRVADKPVICKGCETGTCHYACLPSNELNGLPWNCSVECYQLHLSKVLHEFVEEIEPMQKAAMRKRRRLQGELRSLQILEPNPELDRSTRRTSRGRATTGVDYSFKAYDRMVNDAIRKSERGDYVSSSEEEIPRPNTRQLSREERMELREKRHLEASGALHVHESGGPSIGAASVTSFGGENQERVVSQEEISEDVDYRESEVNALHSPTPEQQVNEMQEP
jgi:hypothetical protein